MCQIFLQTDVKDSENEGRIAAEEIALSLYSGARPDGGEAGHWLHSGGSGHEEEEAGTFGRNLMCEANHSESGWKMPSKSREGFVVVF